MSSPFAPPPEGHPGHQPPPYRPQQHAQPAAPQHVSAQHASQQHASQQHAAQHHAPRAVAEVTIARIRKHAIRVVLPSLVMIACAGVIGYSFREVREPGAWLWWGILAGAAFVALGLVPVIAWLRTRYTITTYRTTTRKGQTTNTTHDLPHHQVASVEMRRNAWQSIFGSGTIVLLSVSGLRLELRDVPNAVTVTQALRELTGNPAR